MRIVPARVASLLFASCTAIVGLASSEARAVTIRLCECTPPAPIPEFPDVFLGAFTIGLRIEGDPGESIYGAGISAYGYNENVIDFTTGQSVPSIFHAVAIPAIGAFNGIFNVSNPLTETSIGASGNRVQLFNGVGLQGRTYNPLDPGLDGVIGGGGAQIRLTFTTTGPGSTTLRIGTGYPGDGIVGPGGTHLQSNTLHLEVIPGYVPSWCPIPEPNAALLAGLGLATLAARRTGSRPAAGAAGGARACPPNANTAPTSGTPSR